jgi:hypothetical protein
LLVPMVDNVQRACGELLGQLSADSGFFSLHNLEVMEERAIDAYVPDSNMAGVLTSRGNTETTYASCGPSAHAQQVSFDDRTSVIPTAESVG